MKPRRDNLVERPWGGSRLCEFKSLTAAPCGTGRRFGESFELSADDGDEEARQHPSVLPLEDGSTITLPALLALHAETVLGADFVQRHGRRLPLLPKLLDVAELLSVQAHPPGNTEVYVVVEADAGATIRLGFAADVDADVWAEQLASGRRDQQRLVELCANSADELQTVLKPWLARRAAKPAELEAALRPRGTTGRWPEIESRLAALHECYWTALDSLNAIPVKAGDVIYNANPARIALTTGKPVSAEVHALGNTEGRGVLALEIRRPGTTFRAWDNVRFPLRAIDIAAALEALNLKATKPADFVVAPQPVRPGVRRSVDSEYFRLEHLDPTPRLAVDVRESPPHCLHALSGTVNVTRGGGELLGTLERGESALVPARVGAYRVAADGERASLVKVDLPPYVD
ncbi:MAG TPA: type I phosphomannose isomerase catalytic subunit [Gammaproteobacteria bacterium]|nr:type I phosphomannose isomerase catalytic subunit [Gammaproteobacteria bacterium]